MKHYEQCLAVALILGKSEAVLGEKEKRPSHWVSFCQSL